jgi:membrane associated rhomboid family serine protease
MKSKVTLLLIALNVAGFLWEFFIGGAGAWSGDGPGAQRVFELGALSPASVLQGGQWWRIVTSAFLHDGYLHIGVNMISLWSLGRAIESIVGSGKMLVIYVVSMIASGLGVIFLSSPDVATAGTVGASGAIFGLFGALFAIGLKFGKPGMEMIKANVGILVLNIFISLLPGISWQAHLSGAVAGFLLTLVIYFPPRRVAPVVVDAQTGAELETEYQAPTPPNPQSRA